MTKNKKICHVSTVHRGLDIRIFWKECVALAEHGFDVSLVIEASAEQVKKASEVGVSLVALGLPLTRSRFWRLIVRSLYAFRLSLKTGAATIHLHDPELLLLTPLYKLAGRKVIYDAHEDLPKQLLGKHWISPTLRPFLSKLVMQAEHMLVGWTDAVATAAPPITERLARINKRVITLVNYPLRAEVEKNGAGDYASKTGTVICYAGAITVERGALDMVDALDHLPGVTLELCGPISPDSLLAEMQAKTGWKQVKFHGMLDRQGVMAVYQRASLGLAMLHATPSHIQWVPIKLFEYMSANLPVITPPYKIWKEFVEKHHCGVCIEPQNPLLLAQNIKEILANKPQLMKMAENGRSAVISHYSWESELPKLVALYAD
jgi:glycosyltransferase involved in cell wall biosynthesis